MSNDTYLSRHYTDFFKKYSTEDLLKDIDSYQNGGGQFI